MGGIPGNAFPLFRKFGKFPEPGNGKGGLAVRRARRAALAAMLSLRGRGLGSSWDILWSIMVFSGASRGWGGSGLSDLFSLRSSPGYLGGNPRAPGRKIVVAVLKLKNADFNGLWHSCSFSALLGGYWWEFMLFCGLVNFSKHSVFIRALRSALSVNFIDKFL